MKGRYNKLTSRERVKKSIRSRIRGTSDRPRVSIFCSNRYISAQAIDDEHHTTLSSIFGKEKTINKPGINKAIAEVLGKKLGERLLEKKIQTLVFDRNGYRYHGVVKAFADGIRAMGLKF